MNFVENWLWKPDFGAFCHLPTMSIWMSHWHHTMVDGAEFWISCQRLKLLWKASQWKLIQSSAPSTIRIGQTQQFPCWLLVKNLANFVSLPLKIDNPYYHTVEKWKLEGKLDNRKAVSKHSKEKDWIES